MEKEVQTLIEYARESIHCIYADDVVLLKKIAENWSSIQGFEKPDIIIPIGDKVLAIEHFEFDASSVTKKGSIDKRELATRNRKFDKLIQEQESFENPLITHGTSDCVYSAENYIKNFKANFSCHYGKIADYKTHLVYEKKVKSVSDIIMCFFVVDTTPLGCYYMEDGMKYFIAFQVNECLDIISKSKDVDCLFFGFFDGQRNSLEFLSNRIEVIEYIKTIKMLDFKVDEFMCFHPQEIRFCNKVEEPTSCRLPSKKACDFT